MPVWCWKLSVGRGCCLLETPSTGVSMSLWYAFSINSFPKVPNPWKPLIHSLSSQPRYVYTLLLLAYIHISQLHTFSHIIMHTLFFPMFILLYLIRNTMPQLSSIGHLFFLNQTPITHSSIGYLIGSWERVQSISMAVIGKALTLWYSTPIFGG